MAISGYNFYLKDLGITKTWSIGKSRVATKPVPDEPVPVSRQFMEAAKAEGCFDIVQERLIKLLVNEDADPKILLCGNIDFKECNSAYFKVEYVFDYLSATLEK